MSKRRFFMIGPIFSTGLLLFVAGTITTQVTAQELLLEELLPAIKDQAIVLDIVARVVEKNHEEVWNSVNSKVTIMGRPVGIKLVGTNIIIVVQFTPYLRADGNNVLVAQGQVWIDVPNQGMSYQTTIQTIPLEFGEQVYFFPLGSVTSEGEAHIEIQLVLHPYMRETPPAEAAPAATSPTAPSNTPLAPPAASQTPQKTSS